MDQSRMPLGDALAEYISSSRVSMHIPGHKKKCMNTIPELEAMIGSRAIACDITEIEGFDDYHEPEGIIKEAMQLAAELFLQLYRQLRYFPDPFCTGHQDHPLPPDHQGQKGYDPDEPALRQDAAAAEAVRQGPGALQYGGPAPL